MTLAAVTKDMPLIYQLIRREVHGRYRGTWLGALWSLLTPLFMLAVYTFVFGAIFQAKWVPPSEGSNLGPSNVAVSTTDFAIILFIGLIIFNIFAEVITRAPTLILTNVHYVKRIVFPLETLVPVSVGSSLVHAGLSLAVLLGFMLFKLGSVPLTALWLPVVVAPFLLLTLGLGWLFASLGVYLRDISQILPSAINALMFLSPIFFPASALPTWLREWLFLNPLALPIEQARAVLVWGETPRFEALTIYALVATSVALFGYQWFQKTRKGFADVI
jgi:lipopolysaccharide transport system permease protein